MRTHAIAFVLGVLASCGGADPEGQIYSEPAPTTPLDEQYQQPEPDPEQSCKLGTLEHCSACNDSCYQTFVDSSGKVTTTVISGDSYEPVCRQRQCDISCREDRYDVNGDPSDGCEATGFDWHPTPESAAPSEAGDCIVSVGLGGSLLSDDRVHLDSPASRRQALVDWHRVDISDGVCAIDAKVRLDLSAFSAASQFRLTAVYVCKGESYSPANALSIESGGGNSNLELQVDVSCDGWDDSGSLYVSVEKLSGEHSAAHYELTIIP